MAKKIVVKLVDDIDGTVSEDIGTISFGLDGAEYEIDLTETNATRLRDELATYIGAARRIGGRAKRRRSAGADHSSMDRERTKAIRQWGRTHGYELAERGRISTDVVTAYEQAQIAAAKPKARRNRTKASAGN